jgi:hypothetical protein
MLLSWLLYIFAVRKSDYALHRNYAARAQIKTADDRNIWSVNNYIMDEKEQVINEITFKITITSVRHDGICEYLHYPRNTTSLSLPPPPPSRGTLAGERGGGRVPIPTRGHTMWYSICTL